VTSPIQLIAIVGSAGLLLLVLELVRRRRLTEEYSLIWIALAVALLVLSAWRESLDVLARWIGIYYPPALLILVLIFFVFGASLYFSLVISRQRIQIERLIEEVAILAALQRDEAAARRRDRTDRNDDGAAAQPSSDSVTST
jgi:hypothetical protein